MRASRRTSRTHQCIGYVEYSYVLLNPSLLKGVARSSTRRQGTDSLTCGNCRGSGCQGGHHNSNFSIDWQPGATAYPIAGYTWAIVWKVNQTSDAQGTLLVKYLDWLSHSAQSTARPPVKTSQRSRAMFPSGQHPGAGARHAAQGHGSRGQVLLGTNGG